MSDPQLAPEKSSRLVRCPIASVAPRSSHRHGDFPVEGVASILLRNRGHVRKARRTGLAPRVGIVLGRDSGRSESPLHTGRGFARTNPWIPGMFWLSRAHSGRAIERSTTSDASVQSTPHPHALQCAHTLAL
jgi:hypothetical protein